MAPPPITEDYYLVLEVEQTATPKLVYQSYKRLALKLHPDRNARHDATEAFQLLGRAYETLRDESKRRDYDRIYPSIERSRPSPQTTQYTRPPPTSAPQSGVLSEAAQIVALEKLKQERSVRWETKKNAFDSSISKLQKDVWRLEQEIKNLDSITATEVAEELRKNSWGAWLLSPIHKKAEDSEEEKVRKDRERQERRVERDMKERRLGPKRADLKKEESLLRMAKEEIDAADLVNDKKIRVLQERIWARKTQERQERERAENERKARIWKQQQEQREKQEREAAEALRKKLADERAAEQKRQEEQASKLRKQQAEERAADKKRQEKKARKWQKIIDNDNKDGLNQYAYLFAAEGSTRQASTSACCHDGWWSKEQGRTACPKCYEIWNYLLQCPGCKMKACPKCQAAVRPRRSRYTARTDNARTPSPVWYYDD